MNLALSDSVSVLPYAELVDYQTLSSISFTVDLGVGPRYKDFEIDIDDIETRFRNIFGGQYFKEGQVILMDLQSAIIICTVKGIESKGSIGKVTDSTRIDFYTEAIEQR